MHDALTIYQDVLDRTGTALVAGDVDTFMAHVALPCTLATETQTIVIDTHATARRHFDGFHAALKAQKVDAYTRLARAAQFDAPDRIRGRHDTIITSGGKLVVPRFENEMEIILCDDVWGLKHVRHRTRYVAWPDVLPRGGSPHD